MAAKFLHSLTDESPDLRKQIGCMTGILHLFDRNNAITTKRIAHKRLPSGHSQSNCGGFVSTVHHQEKANESSLNENSNDKQSVTAKSSRDSPSSCSSSLSSLECNTTAQLEALSFSRINTLESPSMGSASGQSNTSSYSERQPFNIKHAVKDSMHREVRTSFVKMTDEDDFDHDANYRHSLKSLPMSKCAEISSKGSRNRKQGIPTDIKESFRVLAKLKDAPRNFKESTKRGKSLFSRDSPRLSYDGREKSQFSHESRNLRSSPKVKELPRLSLDSRDNSAYGFSSISVRTPICMNFPNSICSTDKASELHISSSNQKRLPSVVAKLMGLETLPDSYSATDTQCGGESFENSLESRNLKTTASDKSSSKCPTSPQQKKYDHKKTIPTSRLPIETAPWRKLDGTQVSKSTACKPVKGPAPSSSPSIYGEVEMRLKDLELQQSSKDLIALKKILEAVQIRALSEIGMQEQGSVCGIRRNQEPKSSTHNQKTRSMNQRNRCSGVVVAPSTTSEPSSSKAYESSIIIMRPAKTVDKSVISTSMIPMDRFPVLHKLQNEGVKDSKKGSSSRQTRARFPKNTQKDLAVITSEKKPISRYTTTSSSKQQLVRKESSTTTSSIKSSDSVSPRLRPRKTEMEKRSHSYKPGTNKPKRKTKQTDSNCHCGKIRPKSSNIRQCDDQSSEMSNESRALSCQSDDITQQSDVGLSLDSKIDIEVTSSMQTTRIDGNERQAMETAELLTTGSVKKLSMVAISEDGSTIEQDAIALEHPSPVSVLNGSLYRDNEVSPVKKITTILDASLEGDDSLDYNVRHNEDQCNLSEDIFVNSLVSNHNVEIESTKFENIEDLIQELRCLNSVQDEEKTDYTGLLCENTNSDHRYIAEILLASGLLLRDPGSSPTTFQHHPSGNPINPELFYVLEKTKACGSPPKVSYSNRERSHHKLIFDVVNEILVEKLSAIDSDAPEPWLKPTKIAKESLSGQKILKQLCNEIEHFQAKKFECNFDEEKDDSMCILLDDAMRRSRSWTDFHGDIYNNVLDVERLIFKDLVNEFVIQ